MAHNGNGLIVNGCRVKIVTEIGQFEATVANFNVSAGLLTVKDAVCIPDGKKIPRLVNFMKNEILQLSILSVPKQKRSRIAQAGTGGEDGQSTSSTKSSQVSENSVPKLLGVTSDSQQSSTEAFELALNRTPSCETLPTEQPFFGGTPLVHSKSLNRCSGDVEKATYDFMLLETFCEDFCMAIKKLKSMTVIGLAMEGKNVGRNAPPAWIMMSTKNEVFVFDVIALGEKTLMSHLRPVFENENILKVVHDSRAMSDLLFHRYRTKFVNIFDTQVARIFVFRKQNGFLPKEVESLAVCLLGYMNLPEDFMYFHRALADKLKKNPDLWHVRPAPDSVLRMVSFNVRYLRELRLRLMERMLGDFVDGIDIFLGTFRDAESDKLEKMQNMTHVLPLEFRDIQGNGEASRKRMEELLLRDPALHGLPLSAPTVDKFSVPKVVEQNGVPDICPSVSFKSSVENTSASTPGNKSSPQKKSSSSDTESRKIEREADEKLSTEKLWESHEVMEFRKTAQKSDHFVVIAAGSERSYHAAQHQKKPKGNAAHASNGWRERNKSDVDESGTAKPSPRCINVFEDFCDIPSPNEKLYIGQCPVLKSPEPDINEILQKLGDCNQDGLSRFNGNHVANESKTPVVSNGYLNGFSSTPSNVSVPCSKKPAFGTTAVGSDSDEALDRISPQEPVGSHPAASERMSSSANPVRNARAMALLESLRNHSSQRPVQ